MAESSEKGDTSSPFFYRFASGPNGASFSSELPPLFSYSPDCSLKIKEIVTDRFRIDSEADTVDMRWLRWSASDPRRSYVSSTGRCHCCSRPLGRSLLQGTAACTRPQTLPMHALFRRWIERWQLSASVLDILIKHAAHRPDFNACLF